MLHRCNQMTLFEEKMKAAIPFLQQTEGRALILFTSKQEMQQFKQASFQYPEYAAYAHPV